PRLGRAAGGALLPAATAGRLLVARGVRAGGRRAAAPLEIGPHRPVLRLDAALLPLPLRPVTVPLGGAARPSRRAPPAAAEGGPHLGPMDVLSALDLGELEPADHRARLLEARAVEVDLGRARARHHKRQPERRDGRWSDQTPAAVNPCPRGRSP